MPTISTLPSAAGNITDSSTDYHLVTLKFLVCSLIIIIIIIIIILIIVIIIIIIRERCGPSNDQSVA